MAGIGLSVDAMADAVRAYRIGQSGFVYRVRDDGSIVVHRGAALADGTHKLQALPGFSSAMAQRLPGRADFAQASYAAPDGKRLVAASYVPDLNLYVVAEVPEAEALGGIARASTLAALVASEVRSLAQRSASAAREIKDLISDSVDKVEAGSRLVDSAGGTMAETVDSVRRVADLMAGIDAASGEQGEGITRVNGAIEAMDDNTRWNAALVEQATAAALALQEQSARLAQVVAGFSLAEDGA